MTRTPRDVPEAELAVLELLWRDGPATRRQVADVLYPGGAASQYATVQKLLERLEQKGYVGRASADGQWRFSAVVSRDELISRRIEEVVDRLCGGSLTPLLMNLVKSPGLTAEQLNELRRFVREQSRQEGER
jgi:BlaI family transcriptional regulator, penicillinase repressor